MRSLAYSCINCSRLDPGMRIDLTLPKKKTMRRSAVLGVHSMKLAIVTACSSDWLPMACASLLSCARNRTVAAENFIIMQRSSSATSAQVLRVASALVGEPIRAIEFDRQLISSLNTGKFHESAVYRLAMDKLIDHSFDRVLYLDSDLLVLKSLDNFLTCDLQDYCAAAVADFGLLPGFTSSRTVKIRGSLGFAVDRKYFNSGVMLFSWKQALAAEAFHKARELLIRHNFNYADQDALNIVLADRWREMHPKYNVQAPGRNVIEPSILHFTCKPKPWSLNYSIEDLAYHSMYREVFKELGVKIEERRRISSALGASKATLETLRALLRPSRRNRIKQRAERREREMQNLVPIVDKYAQQYAVNNLEQA